MRERKLLEENGIPKSLHFLFERCLINNFTDIKKLEATIKNKEAAYVGFDVTRPSLQIGNWMSINAARLLSRANVKTYIVLGGGTTLVGDPSGKTKERDIANIEVTKHNIKEIKKYLGKRFPDLNIIDNAEWLEKLKMIDFLRICKGIGLNYLLDRQLIKERLVTTGISTTELFYTLIQGYDFYHLRKERGVTLQFGGSDQWGNFLSGIDLCKKQVNERFNDISAFSTPLLVDAQGNKLGKTGSEPIFINGDYTSSYVFYQWVLNLDDKFLKLFFKTLTDIKLEKIDQILENHEKNKRDRAGHKELAKYLIGTLRSENDYLNAKRISEIMFSNDYNSLKQDDLLQLETSLIMPSKDALKLPLVNLISQTIGESVSNTRRLIASKSIGVNNTKIDLDSTIKKIKGLQSPRRSSFYFVKKGKKNIFVLEIKN